MFPYALCPNTAAIMTVEESPCPADLSSRYLHSQGQKVPFRAHTCRSAPHPSSRSLSRGASAWSWVPGNERRLVDGTFTGVFRASVARGDARLRLEFVMNYFVN